MPPDVQIDGRAVLLETVVVVGVFFSSLLLSIKAAFHYSLKLSPYSQTTVHHGWHPHCLFLRVNILSMTSIDLRCCSCYLLLFFLLSDANFCKETLKVRNSINLLQKFILIKLTQVKLIDWPPSFGFPSDPLSHQYQDDKNAMDNVFWMQSEKNFVVKLFSNWKLQSCKCQMGRGPTTEHGLLETSNLALTIWYCM